MRIHASTCCFSRKLLFISLICTTYLHPFAQSTITGSVQSSSNQTLRMVNVLLLKGNDSALIKGSITNENGDYKIENIKFRVSTL
jgi:hypothetical protein